MDGCKKKSFSCKKQTGGRRSGFKSALLLSLLLFAVMAAAGCASTKLADGYDEKEIKETAEEIINEIQLKGAKEVLSERMREDFIDKVDLDTMDGSVKAYVSGLGEFLSYSRETVIGRHYDETDEDFAVILVTATYEKGEVNYTLTFDQDMTLVGFYPKN